MGVLEDIAEARTELTAGHNRAAARLLNHAVIETLDPELLAQIHELAEEGAAGAGRLRKQVVWEHLLDIAERRGARPQG